MNSLHPMRKSTLCRKMWVTKPGEERKLPGMEAEAARLQGELAAIEAMSGPSACCICGRRGALTVEHAPTLKEGRERRSDDQRGDRRCCVAGSLATPFARPENAGNVCRLDLTVHRQRIAKQVIASFAATSKPGLTDRYPHLRELLLDRAAQRPIAPLRLWPYLRANRGGMTTGLTISLTLKQRKGPSRAPRTARTTSTQTDETGVGLPVRARRPGAEVRRWPTTI
jgi:hypothetical protein